MGVQEPGTIQAPATGTICFAGYCHMPAETVCSFCGRPVCMRHIEDQKRHICGYHDDERLARATAAAYAAVLEMKTPPKK